MSYTLKTKRKKRLPITRNVKEIHEVKSLKDVLKHLDTRIYSLNSENDEWEEHERNVRKSSENIRKSYSEKEMPTTDDEKKLALEESNKGRHISCKILKKTNSKTFKIILKEHQQKQTSRKPSVKYLFPVSKKSFHEAISSKKKKPSVEFTKNSETPDNSPDSEDNKVIFVSLNFLKDCNTNKKNVHRNSIRRSKSFGKNVKNMSAHNRLFNKTQTVKKQNSAIKKGEDKVLKLEKAVTRTKRRPLTKKKQVRLNETTNTETTTTVTEATTTTAAATTTTTTTTTTTSNESSHSSNSFDNGNKSKTKKKEDNSELSQISVNLWPCFKKNTSPENEVSKINKKYLESLLVSCGKKRPMPKDSSARDSKEISKSQDKKTVKVIKAIKNEEVKPEEPSEKNRKNAAEPYNVADMEDSSEVRKPSPTPKNKVRGKIEKQKTKPETRETKNNKKTTQGTSKIADKKKGNREETSSKKKKNKKEIKPGWEVSNSSDVQELWKRDLEKESVISVASQLSSVVTATDEVQCFYNVELQSYSKLKRIVETEITRISKNNMPVNEKNERQCKEKKPAEKQQLKNEAKPDLELKAADKPKKENEAKKVPGKFEELTLVPQNQVTIPIGKTFSELFSESDKDLDFIVKRRVHLVERQKHLNNIQEQKEKSASFNEFHENPLEDTKAKLRSMAEEKDLNEKIPGEIIKNWSILHRLEKAFLALGTPTYQDDKEMGTVPCEKKKKKESKGTEVKKKRSYGDTLRQKMRQRVLYVVDQKGEPEANERSLVERISEEKKKDEESSSAKTKCYGGNNKEEKAESRKPSKDKSEKSDKSDRCSKSDKSDRCSKSNKSDRCSKSDKSDRCSKSNKSSKSETSSKSDKSVEESGESGEKEEPSYRKIKGLYFYEEETEITDEGNKKEGSEAEEKEKVKKKKCCCGKKGSKKINLHYCGETPCGTPIAKIKSFESKNEKEAKTTKEVKAEQKAEKARKAKEAKEAEEARKEKEAKEAKEAEEAKKAKEAKKQTETEIKTRKHMCHQLDFLRFPNFCRSKSLQSSKSQQNEILPRKKTMEILLVNDLGSDICKSLTNNEQGEEIPNFYLPRRCSFPDLCKELPGDFSNEKLVIGKLFAESEKLFTLVKEKSKARSVGNEPREDKPESPVSSESDISANETLRLEPSNIHLLNKRKLQKRKKEVDTAKTKTNNTEPDDTDPDDSERDNLKSQNPKQGNPKHRNSEPVKSDEEGSESDQAPKAEPPGKGDAKQTDSKRQIKAIYMRKTAIPDEKDDEDVKDEKEGKRGSGGESKRSRSKDSEERKYDKTMTVEKTLPADIPWRISRALREIHNWNDKEAKERQNPSMRGDLAQTQVLFSEIQLKPTSASKTRTPSRNPSPNRMNHTLKNKLLAEPITSSHSNISWVNTYTNTCTTDHSPSKKTLTNDFQSLKKKPYPQNSSLSLLGKGNSELDQMEHGSQESQERGSRCQSQWEQDANYYRTIVKDILNQYKRTDGLLKQSEREGNAKKSGHSLGYLDDEDARSRHFPENSQDVDLEEYRKKIMSEYKAISIFDYKTKKQGGSVKAQKAKTKRNLQAVSALDTETDIDVKDYQLNVHKVLDSQLYVDAENLGERKPEEKNMSLQEVLIYNEKRPNKKDSLLDYKQRTCSAPQGFELPSAVNQRLSQK